MDKLKKIIVVILVCITLFIADAFLYSLSLKIFLIINFIAFSLFFIIRAIVKGKKEQKAEREYQKQLEEREEKIDKALDKILNDKDN